MRTHTKYLKRRRTTVQIWTPRSRIPTIVKSVLDMFGWCLSAFWAIPHLHRAIVNHTGSASRTSDFDRGDINYVLVLLGPRIKPIFGSCQFHHHLGTSSVTPPISASTDVEGGECRTGQLRMSWKNANVFAPRGFQTLHQRRRVAMILLAFISPKLRFLRVHASDDPLCFVAYVSEFFTSLGR